MADTQESSEHVCDPCSFDCKNETPKHFCVNCLEYLCISCAKDHRKFKQSRDHLILDELPTDASIYEKLQTLSRCPFHPEVDVEKYCKQHCAMICQYCIKDEHKLCEDIGDLEGFQEDNVDRMTQTLDEIRQTFLSLRTEKDKLCDMLHTNNTTIKKDICSYVQQIRDVADVIEKRLNENHASLGSTLFEDLNEYEQKLANTETKLLEYEKLSKIIPQCGTSKHTQIILWNISNLKYQSFVPSDIQTVASKQIKLETPINAGELIEALKTCTLKYVSNAELAMDMGSDEASGHEENTFVNQGSVSALQASKLDKEIQVDESQFDSQENSNNEPLMELSILPNIKKIKVQTDDDCDDDCHVIATEILSDGRIILLDKRNNEVKLVSVDLQLIASMTVENMPLDMCILEEKSGGMFTLAICFECLDCLSVLEYDGDFRGSRTIECTDEILAVVKYATHIVVLTRLNGSYSDYQIQLIDPATGHVCYAFDEFITVHDGKSISIADEARIHASTFTMNIILACNSTVYVLNIEDGKCVYNTSRAVAPCIWFYRYSSGVKLGTVMDVKTDSQGNIYVCDLDDDWGGVHQVSACSYKEHRILINNCKDVSSIAMDETRNRIVLCYRCRNRAHVYHYSV